VLVLTGEARDAQITVDLLAAEGITGEVCTSVRVIADALDGAGLALIAEEALGPVELETLVSALSHQPAWSDFPFVVFGGLRGVEAASLPAMALGNVALLDRPVRARSMVAAVKSALRGRMRQYEARREIRARDQFLAMLGHELRNPLAAIGVAVTLLARDDDDTARARHRSIIERQSQHLGRLVDDLLHVSRVTHGKVKLERERVDLSDLVRCSAQALDHLSRSGHVTLTVVAPAPVEVDGDRLRLDQVVSNLVGNAMKYTGPGGAVLLEACAEDGQAVLRVRDTGIGIDSDMLPRVFDLFAQAEQSLDRSGGGMGLGLTLVQRLVSLHGGNVRADSGGLGQGSEFTVRLPLAAPKPQDVPLPSPSPSQTIERPRRVVLVDDSDDLRELFEELLRTAGHGVSTGADGPAGVDAIMKARPDVAFVDVGLPGFDGYEVARRVRAALGDAVVLVAMTGYGQNEDRARSMDAGFDRHLTKPVDIGALERLVADAPRIVRARATG